MAPADDDGPRDDAAGEDGAGEDGLLSRTQRRLLRRIYNGRSVPIIADGKPFLTYKEASRYLEALDPRSREMAYVQMKAQAG